MFGAFIIRLLCIVGAFILGYKKGYNTGYYKFMKELYLKIEKRKKEMAEVNEPFPEFNGGKHVSN